MSTNADQQPPKRLTSQLVHLDHSLKSIERQRYAGIQRAPDSLPVLEAFQSFLDEERRRMQRRLVTMSVVLLLIMGLAGAGAIMATVRLGRRVSEQQLAIEQHRQDIEARAQSLARTVTEAGAQSETALAALAERIEQARGAWDDGHTGLEARQAELVGEQAGLDARVSRHEASLSELAGLVASLREDNAALAAQLESAAAELRAPAPATSMDDPEAADTVMHTAGTVVDVTDVAVTDAKSADTLRDVDAIAVTGPTVTLSIIPRGATLPVRWLLPSVATQE